MMETTDQHTLPTFDSAAIPGERLVERSATVIVLFLILMLSAGLVLTSSISMNVTVAARGELEPRTVWTARPRESGIIAAVPVRTGQLVSAGDLLFTIDSTQLAAAAQDLETKVQEAKLEGARAVDLHPIDLQIAEEKERISATAVAQARMRLLSTLVENSRSPNVDSALRAPTRGNHVAIDLARADVLQAESELRMAELARRRLVADSLDPLRGKLTMQQTASQLALMRRRLTALEVRAPALGVVLTDGVELLVGRMVREGDPILEMGSRDGWRAQLLVAESDVRLVKPGQEVQLDFAATEQDEPGPIAGTVLTVAAEPWKPDLAAIGTPQPIGSTLPQYRVIVAVAPTASDTLAALFRRGFTIQAHIHVARERVARVLLERLFNRG